MQRLTMILAVIATVAFLAAGNFYWEKKTSSHSANAKVDSVVSDGEKKKDQKNDKVPSDIATLTEHWPEKAQKDFSKAVEEERTYKLAIAGSEAIGEKDGWSADLKKALEESYGKTIEVKVFEYAERSDEFINADHDGEVAAFKPDLVLFEPFTLNDNGNLEVDDNHKNIETFIETVKAENKNVVVILQPPHPIYGAAIYPQQVEQLKEFADTEGISYIDHWVAWPDEEDEILKSYLAEDQGVPAEKGNEVWLAVLKDYFIAD